LSNNKCLDVHGGRDEEARKVIVWGCHGGKNQDWQVIYVEEAEKEMTKGLNKEYGFHVNRPFYFRSRLPFRRVAEMHGNRYVYLRRWIKNRKGQQWIFDQKSKTVTNMNWKNYALEIQSNGNGRHIY
jgi:hypothetical protein